MKGPALTSFQASVVLGVSTELTSDQVSAEDTAVGFSIGAGALKKGSALAAVGVVAFPPAGPEVDWRRLARLAAAIAACSSFESASRLPGRGAAAVDLR